MMTEMEIKQLVVKVMAATPDEVPLKYQEDPESWKAIVVATLLMVLAEGKLENIFELDSILRRTVADTQQQ